MSRPDPTTALPVTGEAVTLEQRVARLPSRTLALIIDLCVQVPLLVVLLLLAGWAASDLDSASGAALMLLALVAAFVGYPLLVETLSHGRSLGKLALGLRVVRDDGGPARFRHALVRVLFLVPELWLSSGAIGLIASLLSTKGKRLGDHFAGTVVVNERVTRAAAMLPPVLVPPGLQTWAAGLDLTRLPAASIAQAHSLLGRWQQLAPEVRERLAATLAAEVAAYVAPPAPAGVPPAAYLAAVLGERTRRAYSATGPVPPVPDHRVPREVPPGLDHPDRAEPGVAPVPQPTPPRPPDDTPFRLPS